MGRPAMSSLPQGAHKGRPYGRLRHYSLPPLSRGQALVFPHQGGRDFEKARGGSVPRADLKPAPTVGDNSTDVRRLQDGWRNCGIRAENAVFGRICGKKWRTNENWWGVDENGWGTTGSGWRGKVTVFSGYVGTFLTPILAALRLRRNSANPHSFRFAEVTQWQARTTGPTPSFPGSSPSTETGSISAPFRPSDRPRSITLRRSSRPPRTRASTPCSSPRASPTACLTKASRWPRPGPWPPPWPP